MQINERSRIEDLLAACNGTWEISTDDGWKCLEMSHIRIFKKVLTSGSNVLPQKFLNYRNSVAPVMLFTKDGIKGQTLNLQQNAIEVEENCVAIIMDF